MAFDTPGWQVADGRAAVSDILVQESRRAFMSRVYGWMFAGLSVTGLVAVLTVSNMGLLEIALNNRMLLFVAQIGLVLGLSWAAPRISGTLAAVLFMAYAALLGLTLSVIFLVYSLGSIGGAFLMTAGAFGALSVYGTVTKKDLSAWGAFLFMGLVGVVLASLVQMFMHNSMLSFVISCASVVVFAGLTAYDTQKLREMHAATGYSSAASLSVVGALTLYLDFINLFLALLRLFGDRRR